MDDRRKENYIVGEPRLSGGKVFWPLIRAVSYDRTWRQDGAGFGCGGVETVRSEEVIDFFENRDEAELKSYDLNQETE